jgi:hypothetical protein
MTSQIRKDYTEEGQVLESRRYNYTYDENGNKISELATFYDADGKLFRVWKKDLQAGIVDDIKYEYDEKGDRIKTKTKEKVANNDYYNSLSDIKNKLADYGLFNLITRTKEEQFNVVKELGIIDTELYKKYIYFYEVFMINNFIKFLDVEISKYDPTIYVYVGNEKENYDDLADNVKTIYDKNIIKGVKIKFHNNVYEYHLSY